MSTEIKEVDLILSQTIEHPDRRAQYTQWDPDMAAAIDRLATWIRESPDRVIATMAVVMAATDFIMVSKDLARMMAVRLYHDLKPSSRPRRTTTDRSGRVH